MAKRPAEDDEDDLPKVRKRRYKPKKQADDDEDAPSPPGRKGQAEEEDEEDDDLENSISTGYVYLDIALDFQDDCIDWAKEHVLYAIIIGVTLFLIFASLTFFSVHSLVRYLNRPSLEAVAGAYDLGLFPEAKLFADEALRYISRHDLVARAPFVFFQGAALCAIAQRVVPADRRDYYLAAANYLQEAARFNFLSTRAAEGWFLLGKSLFHIGELEQSQLPLRFALEEGYPHTKEIHWYLAQAHFLGASPDLRLAREHLQHFQNEPTVLEEEIAESRLLETLIVLHIESIETAEEIFAKVPRFRQFDIMRNFVEGQIEFFKARRLRQEAIDFETDPNPGLLRRSPVAPAPVAPVPVGPVVPVAPEAAPPIEIPIAPVEVLPMDDAALRELMIPNNLPTPVLGVFDERSEMQQRIAEMRARYADDVIVDDSADYEIIVLPREDARLAPMPPPPPPYALPLQEGMIDPFGGDPILRLAWELREEAAGHYQRAIARFVEVVRLANFHDPWGRASRLLIGICYMEMGDTRHAEDHLRRLIETFPLSHEAAAAAFFVGEQDRVRGNSDAALRSFAHAFEALRRNPNYASLWLPREIIVERCVEMIRRDIERQNYTDAIGLLDALRGVMPADDIAQLRGETYESWAALLQSQAEVTFGERGNELARDAESRWRSAGGAFATLAQLHSDRQHFSDLLWRAAENYRFGKDFRRAVIEYRKFASANLIARRPELHLRRGEMYLHLDFLDEAAYTLEEALRDFPRHFLIPQIRLVLSYVYKEQHEWDRARGLLKLNLVGDATPASGPYRDSMYALGMLSYAQGDLDAAIPFLEDAIKVHPDAIQAADANYTLARAYLGQAEKHLRELAENPPEAVRRSIESIVLTHRHRALAYLEQTDAILTNRQQAIGLTEAERLMKRNAQFLICSVLLDMERYDLAVPRLNAAAMLYQNRPEALDALFKLAFSLRMLGRETEAQTTLRQAEVILNQLEQIGTITDGTHWRNMIRGGIQAPSLNP